METPSETVGDSMESRAELVNGYLPTDCGGPSNEEVIIELNTGWSIWAACGGPLSRNLQYDYQDSQWTARTALNDKNVGNV